MQTKTRIMTHRVGCAVRTILLLASFLFAPTGATAANLADYTAFPPFLPRVVSPNILFMLDYSKSMVRPAYGECSEQLSDCRSSFLLLDADFDPAQSYPGYFEAEARYTCTTGNGGNCVKDAAGEWGGNWLNWLTMTQFDILKKVVVGGDVTPAPEQGKPGKIQSMLVSGVSVNRAVKQDLCQANAPAALCDGAVPASLPYRWQVPESGSGTVIFGAPRDLAGATLDEVVRQTPLPFDFTFFGTTYAAGSDLSIAENGWFSFLPSISAYGANSDLPSLLEPNALVAPYWDDLVVDVNKGSVVKTFILGTAPRRVFVVSFEDLYHGVNGQKVSFQALLFETSYQVVFQYRAVQPGAGLGGGGATVGVESGDGLQAKKYSFNTPGLSDLSALLMTPQTALFTVVPDASSPTAFRRAGAAASYTVNIGLKSAAVAAGNCPGGFYLNRYRGECFDHTTEGLLQEFRNGELSGLLGFRLGIMQPNDTKSSEKDGGKVFKPFNYKDGANWSNIMVASRSQKPTDYTPLAEMLYEATGYFAQNDAFMLNAKDWDTSADYDPYYFKSAGQKIPCAKSYVLMVSSGNYSHDKGTNIFGDAAVAESWSNDWSLGVRATDDAGAEGTLANGGWLDNVAYKAHTTDWRADAELAGMQNLSLYVVNTFGSGSGPGTEVLKKAARYGGFHDLNGNDAYDAGEDDKDGDGVPDTYLEAAGGANLKAKIIAAVLGILKNSAAGSSVSVLSTSRGGEGALYQAYFYPVRVEGQTGEVRWPGYLRAFFLDPQQNLRDDYSGGSPDAALVLSEDRVIQMSMDPQSSTVQVDLIEDDDGILPDSPTVSATVTLDEVKSIWEGGEKLALQDKSQRKIFVWVDKDNNGAVAEGDFATLGGEALELTAANKTLLRPYLQALDDTEAEKIIQYARGNAVSGYRSRCIAVSGASQESGCSQSQQRVWPLGDIVESTPTLVNVPAERYDTIYGDASYRKFVQAYRGRRHVIYVGTNDGLLHAFNAGIYLSGDDVATGGKVEKGRFLANPTSGNGWGPLGLGDELRAFVPHDNLPHLPWLACSGSEQDPAICSDAEYTHVYYVDKRPKISDVRIFNDAASGVAGQVDGQSGVSHPDGWGTILIQPLGLGGGAINVAADFGSGVQTRTFRSGYYAFDVTDPEKPPKLLWRFAPTGLGFATSYPGIVRIADGGSGKWYMVVGSGPENTLTLRDYGSTQTAQAGKIFVVDLKTGAAVKTFALGANTLVGDPTVVDVDLDYSSDVIYVGSATSATSGRVYRINTKGLEPSAAADNWTLSTLFDVDPAADKTSPDPDLGQEMGPLLVGPSVSKDALGRLWVFFGSGRLKSTADLTNSDQQRFYGVKDGCWKSTADAACNASGTGYAYALGDLLNMSAVQVLNAPGAANQVQVGADDAPCGGGGVTSCSYATLLSTARSAQGWYVDLDNPGDPQSSERVLSRSSILGGLVLFSTYQPDVDLCSVYGNSRLYALYYETGTAYEKPAIGTHSNDSGDEYIDSSIDMGQGVPTSVGIAVGETVSGFVQKSTGEVIRIKSKPGLSVRSGATGWREIPSGSGNAGIQSLYRHVVK